jgi:hypothetical protein
VGRLECKGTCEFSKFVKYVFNKKAAKNLQDIYRRYFLIAQKVKNKNPNV